MALASDFCGKIDLLITDVVMPGMGGIEFAAWVGKEFPETKILFTSGHPNHGLTQSGALKSGAAFIAKPFESKTLVAAIRALLNAEP